MEPVRIEMTDNVHADTKLVPVSTLDRERKFSVLFGAAMGAMMGSLITLAVLRLLGS